MASFNWECPHCNRAQTVVDQRSHRFENAIDVGSIAEGSLSACGFAIGCCNPDCKRLTIEFSVRIRKPVVGGYISTSYSDRPLYERRALPASSAKPMPEFIPKPLIEDYVEACLIKQDSPKASATLARRCIQGMIRDFCGIAKPTLAQEISALTAAVHSENASRGVTIETVEAIDHVRKVGNIGAHMEKDIDLIVPVDAGEAQALIVLIEMLFEEWYIARHNRQQKLSAISQISGAKAEAIADGRAAMKAITEPSSTNS